MARSNMVRAGEAAAVVGGGALLAGSWAVAVARERVPEREAQAFAAVNGLPDSWWPVVWVPMQVGSMGGSLAAVALTAASTRDRRLTMATLAGSQAGYWVAKGVKGRVSRGRPASLLPAVHLRENAKGFGYVSGHAAVAFGLACALAPSLPRRWRPALFATGSVVGFGRVYAGAHLPLDVIGGTGVGLLAGTFARWGLGLGGEGLPVRRRRRG